MDPVLKIFIYATAVAVILQMFILLGLAISLRKTSAKVEKLAGEVHGRALPILSSAENLLNESRGKIDIVMGNLVATTGMLKAQMDRLDVTVNDIVDRTRLQVIRADDIVTRTLDRVEETSELVEHTVVSPVRQISGIVQAVSVGVSAFFSHNRTRRRRGGARVTQDEELFI
jgi:ribosome-associated protein YbcJ (S4-like RNA binding protein)